MRHMVTVACAAMALGLGGSTAWAAVTGRLEPAWRELSTLAGRVGGAEVQRTSVPSRPRPHRRPRVLAGRDGERRAVMDDGLVPDQGALPEPSSRPADASPLEHDGRTEGVAPGPHRPQGAATEEAARASGIDEPGSTRRWRAHDEAALPSRRATPPTEPRQAAADRPDRPDTSDEGAGSGGDSDLAAYRAAHRVHFQERAPRPALTAWDRYLDRHPTGRFVLEARYNRGIALVRLERWSEAEVALAPYAEGRYGAYRQRDARMLLKAIEAAKGAAAADPAAP
jgi:hypothetical protein